MKHAVLDGRAILSNSTPAMEFADGYPIGNGRIGVMCFGGPARALFAINHYDLWHRPRVKAKPLPGYFRAIRRNALLDQDQRKCPDEAALCASPGHVGFLPGMVDVQN